MATLQKYAVERGGAGSGNFGHSGRPGEVGGSAPGDGGSEAGSASAWPHGEWQGLKEDVEFTAQTPEEIRAALDHYGATPLKTGGKTIDGVFVSDDYVVEWDGSDYASASSKEDWVNSQDPSRYYPDYEDDFNRDFWSSGGEVYHATPEENADAIAEDGIEPRSSSRGISNRGVGASVFTSADLGELEDGSYGDAIFAIDIGKMAADGVTPYASQEPDVVEYELRGALAHAVGLNSYEYEIEHGQSPNTVILSGHIPAKYLRRVGASKKAVSGVLAKYSPPEAVKGGAGSGNFGHAGRPGEVGGSAPGSESSVTSSAQWDEAVQGYAPDLASGLKSAGQDIMNASFNNDLDNDKQLESLVAVDAHGARLSEVVQGGTDHVILPKGLGESIRETPFGSVTVLHTHPSSSAPSREDFNMSLATGSNMMVVGADGSTYQMRWVRQPKPMEVPSLKDDLGRAYDMAANQALYLSDRYVVDTLHYVRDSHNPGVFHGALRGLTRRDIAQLHPELNEIHDKNWQIESTKAWEAFADNHINILTFRSTKGTRHVSH